MSRARQSIGVPFEAGCSHKIKTKRLLSFGNLAKTLIQIKAQGCDCDVDGDCNCDCDCDCKRDSVDFKAPQLGKHLDVLRAVFELKTNRRTGTTSGTL